jgi:large subunit ribosomal protein L5
MQVISKHAYQTEIVPRLMKQFGYRNHLQAPRVMKVTLNVGLGAGLKDARFLETVEKTLRDIAGQKPVKRLARKSIAAFKIRSGMVVGMMVTLRGRRMWDFLEKLVHISFARVRDFRGLPLSAIDSQGNFSYGFREQLAFPEISADEAEVLHGLQVNVTTSAKTRDEGTALLKEMGFPFKKIGK